MMIIHSLCSSENEEIKQVAGESSAFSAYLEIVRHGIEINRD